jgi:phenylalanyl-tRNA synthetase beta chain
MGPSPAEVSRRLESIGIRAISNVVDATNYVMMELGQPLHAFDYHRLAENRIVVRKAKEKEELETLDGQKRTLEASDLLICDGLGPVALAGIMGGLNSEVMENTRDLLLESACFDPATIRRSSKRLGLSTEASYRFERGTDPEGTVTAVNRLAFLIREWAGGKICKGVWDAHPRPEEPRGLFFRLNRVNEFLGVTIPENEILGALERLELNPAEDKKEVWSIGIPGFRRDLSREEDIIEEVARIYGYDRIPVTLPVGRTVPVRTDPLEDQQEIARDVLEGLGFSEAVTYTFISREVQDELGFGNDMEPVTLLNPISEDMTVMRKSILPGLFHVLRTNLSRRIDEVRLYETGRVFLPVTEDELPEERQYLAGVMSGVRSAKTWYRNAELGDFFDIKGAVESLLAAMGLKEIKLESVDLPYLQTGQSARIMSGKTTLGILGTLHPRVKERYRVRDWAGCFELDLEHLIDVKTKKTYQAVPQYPSVLRDLAILIPMDIPSAQVEEMIRSMGRDLLNVDLFDLYEGKGVPDGQRSLAWSLTFQSSQRTLTDDEVDKSMEEIIGTLEKEYGAKLR